MPRYGQTDRDSGMRLATADPGTDGPILVLDAMKYRDYPTRRAFIEMQSRA